MQLMPLLVSVIAVLINATPAAAADPDAAVPVIWQTPACSHDKLGQVSIQTGTRVTEASADVLVPTVDYRRAFANLAAAAQARGGNAVVVRWHQATYFTRNSRRSHKPVHVQLRGVAIRTHGDAEQCRFALADPLDFEARAGSGKPVEVAAGDAYGD